MGVVHKKSKFRGKNVNAGQPDLRTIQLFPSGNVFTSIRDEPKKIGWTPKITFDELVSEMVKQDLDEAKRDKLCKKAMVSTRLIIMNEIETHSSIFVAGHRGMVGSAIWRCLESKRLYPSHRPNPR